MDNDGNWKGNDQCTIKSFSVDPILNRIYCMVDMHILWSEDQVRKTILVPDGIPTQYNLDFDKVIKVKVQATNGAGVGPFSDVNSDYGARVRQRPAKMSPPKQDQTASVKGTEIPIYWDKIS